MRRDGFVGVGRGNTGSRRGHVRAVQASARSPLLSSLTPLPAQLLALTMLLALTVLTAVPVAVADDSPGWLVRAQREAAADGYTLLDHDAFDRVVEEVRLSGGKSDILLIDVRPDYEFRDGHVPGSVNFEFDLGDRMGMSAAKEQAFRQLAGSDPDRRLVLYCRSPQCVRSAIAATRVARLGYTDVARYPWGWNGWRDRHQGDETDEAGAALSGTLFPDVQLQFAGDAGDRTVLGLPPDASCAWLHAVPGRYLLVMLFNSLCSNCVQEAEAYERWHEENPLPNLPIIGLGIFDSRGKVLAFREQHGIEFPLFPNRKGEVFEELGDGELPKGYLLERTDKGWIIRLERKSGGGPQEFLEQVRTLVTEVD